MTFLANQGYRCIGHDRSGHGRSSQSWNGNDMDAYADDRAALVKPIDFHDAIHVGHLTVRQFQERSEESELRRGHGTAKKDALELKTRLPHLNVAWLERRSLRGGVETASRAR
jgi:hypothetical protein